MNAVEAGAQALEQAVAQRRQPRRLGGHLRPADRGGAAETDDPRDVERAGAEALLVAAAVDLAAERDLRLPAADEQRARTLRTVVLVPGERQEVDAHRV